VNEAETKNQKPETRNQNQRVFWLAVSVRSFFWFLVSSFTKGGDRPMRKIILAIGAWIVAITAAHSVLNVNWQVLMNDRLPEATRKLNVGYIPVT
jgi:hypothetical protein